MSDRSVSKRSQEKRWYTVLAPEQFDRAELGTTPATEPEQVLNRTIETTLGDVMEGGENNVKLTFQVTDVGSDSAYTEFATHELTRDYKRSLVRRGSSKVKAVLTLRTADDYRITVHPVAFTTKVADRSQKEAIRAKMTDLVTEAAAERTFEEFLDSVVQGHLSSAIYNEAKTIYPLRRVEVEKTNLDARPAEVQTEEETAAVGE
ncbi:30S ribosomal protein S3ae [Halodesulfurarchaeum sp.]|uniref:30S ribosomal protein S3ae n=1 Tax=Halodesulfurarchaeum sp. TaxID=1980530 RepID=UPI002FC3DC8D